MVDHLEIKLFDFPIRPLSSTVEKEKLIHYSFITSLLNNKNINCSMEIKWNEWLSFQTTFLVRTCRFSSVLWPVERWDRRLKNAGHVWVKRAGILYLGWPPRRKWRRLGRRAGRSPWGGSWARSAPAVHRVSPGCHGTAPPGSAPEEKIQTPRSN